MPKLYKYFDGQRRINESHIYDVLVYVGGNRQAVLF